MLLLKHDNRARADRVFARLGRLRGPGWLPFALLLAIPIGGCARARATTVPSLPPLEVPAPPPRVLIPVEVVAETPPPEPAPEEPREAPAPAPPRKPAQPPSAAQPPKVAEEPPKPPPPPSTALQTKTTAEQDEEERAIRATMARASGDLSKVDYRLLNAGARTQYDTAKRFIEQAEDAIRLKNLLFARNVADKAAVIAAELLGQ